MSLVSDRGLGLFELFRVGPIGAGRVLLAKYVAYTSVGAVVSAALLAAINLTLDVPMRGDVGWLAAGIGLLLVASIGFGSVVSLVSQTPTQAVQYALLGLLASLFFCGLFLDIGSFVYPVKAVIWVFPATYGTRVLRDVMLRGADPSASDLIGLVSTSVGFALISWFLLARRLRAR
jgi:ABC-2 type transport system permease protein